MVVVVAFFVGIALFIPPPAGAVRLDQHRLSAHILMGIGVILGLAHCLALTFTSWWPTRLHEFYTSLGLHSLMR